MANKLKDIFNNDLNTYKGNIVFKDDKTAKDFNEALNNVFKYGETIQVPGKLDISIGVDTGTRVISVESSERVSGIIVSPSAESVDIPIFVDEEKKKITVDKYYVNDGVIFKTQVNYPFEIKIFINRIEKKVSLNFRPQINKASSVDVLYQSVKDVKGLLNVFFVPDLKESDGDFDVIINSVEHYIEIFDRLRYLEKTFGICFNPANIDFTDEDSYKALSEICLSLRDKKILKKNTKLNYLDSKFEVHNQSIIKMSDLIVSYLSSSYYEIWGQNINVYSVYYLGNAIVKDIVDLEDGKQRVIYGDDEHKPMYIAYKNFITEDEAKKELANIMDHLSEYINAKSFEYYYYGE